MASELVLAPVVDRTALKKTEMQIAQSMEMAGKKGSLAIHNEMKKQVKRGVVSGFDDGMKPVSTKLKALGIGIAAAAGAVVHDTLQKTFISLDENIDRIMGKLETVGEMTRNAEAFGIDAARYAAISVMGASAQMDQSDIQGIMAGFVAALKDEEMSGFASIAQQQGTEKAFFDFLSSTAKLGERDRQQQLIATFGEDDFRLVSRFMNPMMKMQQAGQELSLATLFKQMTGATLDLGAIEAGLGRTRQAQGIVTQQQTEALLKSIVTGVSPGQAAAVTQVAESQRRLEAQQMSTLELQVKARIIANELEVKQIQAGSMMAGSVMSYSESVGKFIDKPSWETYKETIPAFRWFNPEGGASIISPETRKLLEGGALDSGVTLPMDTVSEMFSKMVESLQSIADNTFKTAEESESSKHRNY